MISDYNIVSMARTRKLMNQTAASAEQAPEVDPQAPAQGAEFLLARVEQLQKELKSVQAELKIHKDAWASEADKYASLSAKVDLNSHEQAAVTARLTHVMKLIRAAESAYYEQFTTHDCFDADGWREMYQKLVRAAMPLFMHRE